MTLHHTLRTDPIPDTRDQGNTATDEGNAPRAIDLITRAIEGDYIPKHEITILGFALRKVKHDLEKVTAQRDQFETMYKDELTWYNDMKAQRDELLAACKGLLKLGIFRGLDNHETRNEAFATIHRLRDAALAAIAKVEGSAQ